jgi:hypothetical protein
VIYYLGAGLLRNHAFRIEGMDVIIACHCPEPIHSKLMIYNSSKGWIHLTPAIYAENGIKSLQYVHPGCAPGWDDIADSSIDIIYTVHCPIGLLAQRLAKNRTMSGADILEDMYKKLRPSGYIVTHIPISKSSPENAKDRKETFAQNIQMLFPDAMIEASSIYRDEFGTESFPVFGLIKDSHLSQAQDRRLLLVAVKITRAIGGRRKGITRKRRHRKQKKTRVRR